jgi:hypothetical protein
MNATEHSRRNNMVRLALAVLAFCIVAVVTIVLFARFTDSADHVSGKVVSVKPEGSMVELCLQAKDGEWCGDVSAGAAASQSSPAPRVNDCVEATFIRGVFTEMKSVGC